MFGLPSCSLSITFDLIPRLSKKLCVPSALTLVACKYGGIKRPMRLYSKVLDAPAVEGMGLANILIP